MYQKLCEYLTVIVTQADQQQTLRLACQPLYESGTYGLSVSLTANDTTVQVLFGKEYENLILQKIDVMGLDDVQPEGDINLSLQHMMQYSDQTLVCLSDQSSLTLQANMRDKNQAPDAKFVANIVFRPVSSRKIDTVEKCPASTCS